jgi:hypothetical protein
LPGLPAALVSTVKPITTRAVAFITGPFLAISRGHPAPPEISAPHKMLTKKTGYTPYGGAETSGTLIGAAGMPPPKGTECNTPSPLF